ncbi:coiled-coil domain-containing protein 178 [Echeneis naucrates]|uniref:coiled-coil domain-containing protein 178 n=1 Tax=Echeneis naucrates TaxID=173247 RepID=UPI001113AFAE|nr:coiled-coil domain-containing protein 178 [Echeneis naucrates]
MPDVEPLRFPSAEERPSQQDLQFVCSGRRRTCPLLNSPSPCVNNVLHHMQELKMILENWCQQSGKYQPLTNQGKHQYSNPLRVQTRDLDTDSMMSTDLFVEGFSINARESCPSSPLVKKINDALGEVAYVIERLEADRQYAEEALSKEKRRKRFLENKVDSISLWKQQERCFFVQKEHEACARYITELKWQVKLEREKLDQAQEKLSHTEILNQHLQENINFAKKQIPIVKENLEIQERIINKINTTQAEATEIYSKTQRDLTMAEKELKKMELDANYEQISLDHALLTMNNQLAKKLEDLNQLKMLEKDLCGEINDAEMTVALMEEKCAALIQRIPEIMELEKSEKDQILQLKLQIDERIQKNKKLKEKVIALLEDIEKCKLNGEAEISCVQEQLNSKRSAFSALDKENMQYEQNAEDYKLKISESEKAVMQMCEERKHMLQKIIDNDEQWEKAKEEVTQIVAQHSVTQTKLEEQEKLTFMEEQRARKEIENLRKDLTGQTTALELLKSECASINERLKQQQRSSELANQKLLKEFEDASSATKALTPKIEKIKKVTENLEKLQCEHNNTLVYLETEKKLKGDHLKAAQVLHTAITMRCVDTLGRISDLTKKSREYHDASDKLEKIVEKMPKVIAELQSEFDVLDFKNKSAALIISTLESDINNCQQRTQRFMQTRTAHVKARRKKMEDAKEKLKMALRENNQLASKYEDLQKIVVKAMQEASSALSKKNYEHKTWNYYTRLSLLQKRMHKALVKYFEQRSLNSEAELDLCQTLYQETNQKIKTAQEELSEEIQHISAFLQSLTDDSTTTDDARVNKQASPDASGWNE